MRHGLPGFPPAPDIGIKLVLHLLEQGTVDDRLVKTGVAHQSFYTASAGSGRLQVRQGRCSMTPERTFIPQPAFSAPDRLRGRTAAVRCAAHEHLELERPKSLIETQLAPTLQPVDVIILDNLSSHESPKAAQVLH